MTGIIYALAILIILYFALGLLNRSPQPVVVTYEEYIRSPQWRELAREVKARAGWKCELCKSKRDLQVHHKTYVRLGRERLEDLECLCDNCHRGVHGLE